MRWTGPDTNKINLTGHNMDKTNDNSTQSHQSKGLHLVIRPVHVFIVFIFAFFICIFFAIVIISIPHAREAKPDLHEVNKLRLFWTAAYTYADENADLLPPFPYYLMAFAHETESQRDLFSSPYRKHQTQLVVRRLNDDLAVRYGDFVFLELGTNIFELQPSSAILAYSARISDDQTLRSVLFADGRVERMDEQKFRAALSPDVDIDALDGP